MTDRRVPPPVTVGENPRFRERRIELRRAAGRRRLIRLMAVLGVAAVVGSVGAAVQSPFLDVDRISVIGTRQSAPSAVAAATGVERGDALVTADLAAVARRVEALPWVLRAEVGRDLPGTLVVRVVERRPAAAVAGRGGTVLVDDSGRVLAPATEAVSPPLVQVRVPGDVPPAGKALDPGLRSALDLAVRLRSDPAGAVSALEVTPAKGDTPGSITAVLAGGGTALIGDGAALGPEVVDTSVDALRAVIARVDLTCLDVIDLRVPTHPVLKRHDGC